MSIQGVIQEIFSIFCNVKGDNMILILKSIKSKSIF